MIRRANGEGSVYLRGDRRYAATATVRTPNGTSKRIYGYGRTRAHATETLRRRLDERQSAQPSRRTSPRLSDYLDYWLQEIVRVSCQPRTHDGYESVVRRYLKPALGGWRLAELDVATVRTAFNKFQATGSSARMIAELRKVLGAALSQACREELINRNVARLIRPPRHTPKETVPWTAEQLSQFLHTTQDADYYGPFLLMCLYGLRRGESVGLRWSDIDFNAGVLRIRRQVQRLKTGLHLMDVKTAASRRDLPLLAPAADYLSRLPRTTADGDSLVFTTATGKPIDPNNVGRSFHVYRERAGLPRIRLHGLRHTTATLLKNTQVPLRDTQHILGHASPQTTLAIYQHSDLAAQRQALTGITVLLAAVSDTRPALLSKLLSNRLPGTPLSIKNASFVSGGPAGDRTRDTLLKSLLQFPWYETGTSVSMVVIVLQQRLMLGHVAVTTAVNASRHDDRMTTS